MIEQLPAEVVGLGVAVGSGLLIGIEREQHKVEYEGRAPAGVRTCALFALSGALAMMLGPIALAVGGAFVVAAAIASYWHTREHDPGLTTEIALVVTYLLGAVAMRSPGLAAAVAVLATLLLESKSFLHHFAQRLLSEQELYDALVLLASILIVLPLLPETPLGPFQALNLRRLWTLVVVVLSLNAAGYVAIRAFGPRLGLPLTGMVGGLVSSAATIASLGHRSREHPDLLRPCAAGAMFSNLSTVAMLVVVLVAVSPSLARHLAPMLVASGVVVVAYSTLLARHAFSQDGISAGLIPSRPFHFGHALKFAGLIAVVLLVSAALNAWLGEGAIALTAAAVGFADTHAAAVSVAELNASGTLAVHDAVLPVLYAFSANTFTKIVLARQTGGAAYARLVTPGLALMLVAAWAAWALVLA